MWNDAHLLCKNNNSEMFLSVIIIIFKTRGVECDFAVEDGLVMGWMTRECLYWGFQDVFVFQE